MTGNFGPAYSKDIPLFLKNRKTVFAHNRAEFSLIIVAVINMWLGFDLRGIVAGLPSEAEWLMHRLGMRSFGHLFSAGVFNPDKINQDISRCNNCHTCIRVCPKGVFEAVGMHKIRVHRQRECFSCNACVTQCPERENSIACNNAGAVE